MDKNHRTIVLMLVCFLPQAPLSAAVIEPLVRVVDLDVGEIHQTILHNGDKATVKLLELGEKRDSVRNAVRRAKVKVKVNGQVVSLVSSTYHLPKAKRSDEHGYEAVGHLHLHIE